MWNVICVLVCLFSGVSHIAKDGEFPFLQAWRKRGFAKCPGKSFSCLVGKSPRQVSPLLLGIGLYAEVVNRNPSFKLSCSSQSKDEAASKCKIVLEKTFSVALPLISSFASTATCINPILQGSGLCSAVFKSQLSEIVTNR